MIETTAVLGVVTRMDRDGWIEMDGWFRGLDLLDMMDFLFIGYFHLIGIAKFIYLTLASVVYYFCIDPNTQNLRIRNLRSPRFLIWLRRLYVHTYCTAKGTWIVFYARIQAENQSESRILSSRNSSFPETDLKRNISHRQGKKGAKFVSVFFFFHKTTNLFSWL